MDSMLNARIKSTAEVLSPYIADCIAILTKVLNALGVDDSSVGIRILQSTVTEEEFLTALSQKKGMSEDLPGPRVRAAFEILKGNDPFRISEPKPDQNPVALEAIVKRLEQSRPIGQWSDMELLARYGQNCAFEVEEEVARRSKNRPCIVFDGDSAVDIETSCKLLREARHHNTPSTYLVDNSVGGKQVALCRVYKAGDYPMNVMYECPVHSNILLVDGYCEECGIKWTDLENSYRKNVFIRLISEAEKITPSVLLTLASKTFIELTEMYPKIFIKFQDMEEEGKLYGMKRRVSQAKDGDPFRVIHKSY